MTTVKVRAPHTVTNWISTVGESDRVKAQVGTLGADPGYGSWMQILDVDLGCGSWIHP